MDKRTLSKLTPDRIAFRKKVVEAFSVLRSYTKTGRAMGISRQRVHQIVAKYNTNIFSKKQRTALLETKCERCGKPNPTILHHKDLNHNNNDPLNLMSLCSACHGTIHKELNKQKPLKECSVCKKKIRVLRLQHSGMCINCSGLVRRHKKNPDLKYQIRTIFFPNNCTACGKDISLGSPGFYQRAKGMCRRCYDKSIYKTNPERRERHKIAQYKWNAKNKDRLKISLKRAQKKYWLKVLADPVRHEAFKAKSREDYRKNKEKYQKYFKAYAERAKRERLNTVDK